MTQALSLMVYYDGATETAEAIAGNIRPPLPTAPPPQDDDGTPEPPGEPLPVPPPTPANCPTLTLPAVDKRAQTVCKMADDLPGARCIRQWGGLALVVEPFD